jgi:hypothetical protein
MSSAEAARGTAQLRRVNSARSRVAKLARKIIPSPRIAKIAERDFGKKPESGAPIVPKGSPVVFRYRKAATDVVTIPQTRSKFLARKRRGGSMGYLVLKSGKIIDCLQNAGHAAAGLMKCVRGKIAI